jgi:hypothetical protein
MSIITRTRPAVKLTRNAPRHNRPFGEGIIPDRRERLMPYTDTDLQWNAETSPANATGYEVIGPTDADFDFAAGCAMDQARLDAGFSLF